MFLILRVLKHVDGVLLGGCGHVNDADITGNEAFLKTVMQEWRNKLASSGSWYPPLDP